ncbi:MAG: hypothetical protein JWM27_4958 [Gemmatimonadetes bacterium]|nr:hypothetical protein [Gemmatimonadota bacterium]
MVPTGHPSPFRTVSHLRSLALSALLLGTAALPACSRRPDDATDPRLGAFAPADELAQLASRFRQYPDYTISLAGVHKVRKDVGAGPVDIYMHSYRTVWETPAGMQSDTTAWTRIRFKQYNQELDQQNVALASRRNGQQVPAGAPMEMAYVGNDRYGHWRQGRDGDSFWEFYGKYAMMSHLLGAGSPRVIHRTEYVTYRRDPVEYRRAHSPGASAAAAPAGFEGRVRGAMNRPVAGRGGSSAPASSGTGFNSGYRPARASGTSSGGTYTPSRAYTPSGSYSPPSTRTSSWGSRSRSGGFGRRRH